MSQREVGAALDLPRTTVQARIRKGLDRLKVELGAFAAIASLGGVEIILHSLDLKAPPEGAKIALAKGDREGQESDSGDLAGQERGTMAPPRFSGPFLGALCLAAMVSSGLFVKVKLARMEAAALAAACAQDAPVSPEAGRRLREALLAAQAERREAGIRARDRRAFARLVDLCEDSDLLTAEISQEAYGEFSRTAMPARTFGRLFEATMSRLEPPIQARLIALLNSWVLPSPERPLLQNHALLAALHCRLMFRLESRPEDRLQPRDAMLRLAQAIDAQLE